MYSRKLFYNREFIQKDPHKKILNYKGLVLRISDLRTLEDRAFLNDQIIGFFFTYLTALEHLDDILLLQPSLSFWLTCIGQVDPESVQEFVEPLSFSTKKLILFPVNNCDNQETGDNGTHWSLLVFDRGMHQFIHHDTLGGFNSPQAMKLYEAVKGFVGARTDSSLSNAYQLSTESVAAVPGFTECKITPQQTNWYDCGLYVMAIARVICFWHVHKSKPKEDNWFSLMEATVDSSLECTMRAALIGLIRRLKIRRLKRFKRKRTPERRMKLFRKTKRLMKLTRPLKFHTYFLHNTKMKFHKYKRA